MTVLLSSLVVPATQVNALGVELAIAQGLGLPVTAWQPLGVARTILATNATIVSQYSQTVSFLAQGAYASYAALMVDSFGNPITTWMDLRSVDQYNVPRIQATQASGNVPVTNTSGIAYSYSPNNPLHFQNPGGTNQTYTSLTSGTISASSTATSVVVVQADAAYIGAAGTVGSGTTLTLLTPLAGVTVQPLTASLVGSNAETNAALLARCQNKLGSLSPNGASQAYVYIVDSLPVFGSVLPTGLLFTAPSSSNPYGVVSTITRATTSLVIGSGIINVYVANAAGAPFGVAEGPISGITNAVPAIVTVPGGHGLGVGQQAFSIISGVQGATGANNNVASTPAWVASYSTATTLQLNNIVAPGAYVSGGSIEVGDLGMADAAIQAQTVPNGQTAIVSAASNVSVNVTATVYIPAAAGVSAATATSNISAALSTYFSTVPIGGVTAEAAGIVPWTELIVVIANANPSTKSVVMGTPTSDVAIAFNQVPVLGSLILTVTFV